MKKDEHKHIASEVYAFKENPTKSSWSTWSIGKELGVTLKELGVREMKKIYHELADEPDDER
jgi:hypothetical protein